ncbi:poly-gamma-glutamate biosynthesis protein [Sorangium cellulosum]|uniref:Poly-gamma-glutamate biosynthesis protein n=1 Tax=Sorangium cellulosum TaxID=56 RepID=A0A150SIL7_SORCE|nr:poly-gamma-glutamate biosynthesis protein [Sorangium cellulosum]
MLQDAARERTQGTSTADAVTVFLCGDVMTGRGIDQILPCASDPVLYELAVEDARGYIELAERASGPIPRPVDLSYVWGAALEEWSRRAPAVRLVNLETAITTSDEPCLKGINYRMHPGNVPCLTAAQIDCCALANNHILDWGAAGLIDTIAALRSADVATAGAGRDADEAAAPALIEIEGKGRVLIFSWGSQTSGAPRSWGASADRPGIHWVDESSPAEVRRVLDVVRAAKREGDIVVASIHWGPNWGYEVPEEQIALAHALVDVAGVDVVHGHSSHHPKAIEVHAGRLILYGCGDFVNDYEGISGFEAYRSVLVMMYFATLRAGTGELVRLELVPLRMRKFRLHRAAAEDALWLRDVLSREGARFGTSLVLGEDGGLLLRWS